MDEENTEGLILPQKLGLAGGAAVAAAVLWHESPAFAPEVERFFKWVDRVEKREQGAVLKLER